MRAEADVDPAFEELAAAVDSDELCQLLVRSPWGWGSSTRYGEAVSLLRATHGRGTLPGLLVALLLCTCHRWDRVTAKLIAAIEDGGLLTRVELDELAESLLSDEVVAVFPLAWVSSKWLEFDTAEGTTRTVKVSDKALAQDRRRLEPPLRRWAAARALRNDPGRLDGLLESADRLPPRHAAARPARRRRQPGSGPAPPVGAPGAAQRHRSGPPSGAGPAVRARRPGGGAAPCGF